METVLKPAPECPLALPTRATLRLITWYSRRFQQLMEERANRAKGDPRHAAMLKLAAELGYLPEADQEMVLEAMALVSEQNTIDTLNANMLVPGQVLFTNQRVSDENV
jgi:hypothetical protein